jgi:acetyl-CoA C-acetyltransferase
LENVYVLAAVRTAGGKLGGTLKDVLPEELSRVVISEVLDKASLQKEVVDEVIFGQAKQSTDCPNIARLASLMAGLPETTPAYTVHRQCASGMQSILAGALQIMVGYSDLVIAGGVESMSTAPYYIRKARFGYKAGNGLLLDPNTESQPRSQPEESYGHLVMGMTAENLAEKYEITREEQDLFSYESQKKAITAIDSGKFNDEIVPVFVPQKKKDPIVFKVDEFPRRDTSLEKMAKLKPAFKPNGTVTAGSSSGRNDGASAVILVSENMLKKLNSEPLARFVTGAAAGVDPRYMGIGPVPATRKALNQAGLKLDDIELIELNEAFAAQSLACIKELHFDNSITNVNGGAIALGHPLGCSGNRISVTLLHEMEKRKIKYGLATICVAGGLGMATIFERI